MNISKQIGIYIHIPFCKSKCFYCDFNSYAGMEGYVDDYFEALQREIIQESAKLKVYSIKSIFIGGGTPSLVDSGYISEIMELCKRELNIAKNAEITIESNPGTLTYEKLTSYKTSGINRLSIGLQAWQNELLKCIGRIHNKEEFIENYYQARRAGFDNINVDLIFGLPNQSIKDWEETLDKIVELEPEHLSCYSLKIEEDTKFGTMYENNELSLADDDIDRSMYHHSIEYLKRNNYRHYEISNFAKPGYECKHNLIYWKAEEYLGFGAGAHSYFEGERYSNVTNLTEYIKTVYEVKSIQVNREPIDEIESMSEFLILGLRLISGVSPEEFKSRYQRDINDMYKYQIDNLLQRSLIEYHNGRVRLTALGLDLANEVFVEFI